MLIAGAFWFINEYGYFEMIIEFFNFSSNQQNSHTSAGSTIRNYETENSIEDLIFDTDKIQVDFDEFDL